MFIESLLEHVTSYPFISVALSIAIIWVIYFITTKRSNLPGPYGLPFVGYLPFLGKFPHLTFAELGKKYGEVFQVKIGVTNAVILNSMSVIQEAFGNDEAFAGRPNSSHSSLRAFAENGRSIFGFRNGNKRWKSLRKSATRAIALFTSSSNSKHKSATHDGLQLFYKEIDRKKGQPIDVEPTVIRMVSGILSSIMLGFEFDPYNPILARILGIMNHFASFLAAGNLMDNLPFAKYIFYQRRRTFLNNVANFHKTSVEHLSRHTYSGSEDAVQDICDALVKTAAEIPQLEKDKIEITDAEIICISEDLFFAGFGTTMAGFLWLLYYAARYQDVQRKVQKEIDQVLGGRELSVNNRLDMPYIKAVQYETFRIACLAPTGIPHCTMRDTTLRGYFIPKGYTVFSNFWNVHHDENVFPNPEKYKPERFLQKDGSLNVDLGAMVLAFSTGKRRCVGETLVRQQLPTMYVGVLQRYNIKLDPNEKKPNFNDSKIGLIRAPVQYNLIFEDRK